MQTRKPPYPNQQLRQAREQRNWTQERLADLLDTSPFTIHRWEKGTSMPSLYYRQKLIEVFQLPLDSLGINHEEHFQENTTIFPVEAPIAVALPFISPPAGKLVGREDLIQQLHLLLGNAPSPTRIALCGLPGVGKTLLAATIAHNPYIQEQFPDGVLWAGVGRTPNHFAVLSKWNTQVGLTSADTIPLTTPTALAKLMHERIGNRRILFIIDDIWSIDDAFLFVVGGPHCSHIITTRSPAIAHRFAPHNVITVAELNASASIDLLTYYDSDIVTRYTEQVHELIRLVGGLPLALTLIGQSLVAEGYSGQERRVLAALTKLRGITTRLQLNLAATPLERPLHLPDDAPWSLFATVASSDQVLPILASFALRAISVFPPKPTTFSEEAVAAVCGYTIAQTVEALDILTDWGLVESADANRYTIHQVIADYARTTLADSGVYERFVAYALRFCQLHKMDYTALENELTFLLAALNIAEEECLYPAFISETTILAPFLIARGLFEVVGKYLHSVEIFAQKEGKDEELGYALYHLGKIHEGRGQLAEAETYGQRLLALTPRLTQSDLLGFACDLLGTLNRKQGNTKEADIWFIKGLSAARTTKNPKSLISLLLHAGFLKANTGNIIEAEQYLLEGTKIAQEQEDKEFLPYYLNALGNLQHSQGHYNAALPYYEEGLAYAEKMQFQGLVGDLLGNLGVMALYRGDYQQATFFLNRLRLLAQRYGLRAAECAALLNLGNVANQQEQLDVAGDYYMEALEIARETQFLERIAIVLCNLVELRYKQKRYEQAEAMLEEGLGLAKHIEHHILVSALTSHQGDILLAQGHISSAEKAYQQALQIAQEVKNDDWKADALFGLARVAAAKNEMSKAMALGNESIAILRLDGGQYKLNIVQVWLQQLDSTTAT